jgi:isopentenyl-diphosphate delta-isomerase
MGTAEDIAAWVDGRLTPVDKLAVHRRGLRHPAVSVFVMDGTRTLIQRRALGKYHTPGLWANACCTHPHWGETPDACAARRLGEELGISGLALVARAPIEYRAEVGGGLIEHEEVNLFVAEAGPGLVVSSNPAEVMEVRWIELADLKAEIAVAPERFTPWLRIYLAEHAGEIFAASA